jgi:hypothetical protein
MNNFPSDPYICTPKYVNEQIDILLKWSLITASNIKYDNFVTYNKEYKTVGGIRSMNVVGTGLPGNHYLFNAYIESIPPVEEGKPDNFKITQIIEDNIEKTSGKPSGITVGMIFKYNEDYSPNPDRWNFTWYEGYNVDGSSTNIKLIPNIDCPTEPTSKPIPDLSMTSNPKCSQILDTSSGKRSDLTLISDRSSYNGVNNWSITSYDGKKYDGFTINFIFDSYNGYVYRFYNNKDPNFEMYLTFINVSIGNNPQDPEDPIQPGDVIYNVAVIKDTMNLGIKKDDWFFFNSDYNYYSCFRGLSYLPNIKIFPTSCTQYIPAPSTPYPSPTTPPPIKTSTKKNIFFIIGILFLITGFILFYYINKKTKIKFIQNNKKLYSGISIFFIILGIIFIILYLTSKNNEVKQHCINKCETNCGQNDGCGTKCDPTYITDYNLLGNKNWSLITSSGLQYSNFTVFFDYKNLISFISEDVPNINFKDMPTTSSTGSKFIGNITLIDGTKNFKINNIADALNTGIKDNDEFTFDPTTNYYSCGNIKIFPSMCMTETKK